MKKTLIDALIITVSLFAGLATIAALILGSGYSIFWLLSFVTTSNAVCLALSLVITVFIILFILVFIDEIKRGK